MSTAQDLKEAREKAIKSGSIQAVKRALRALNRERKLEAQRYGKPAPKVLTNNDIFQKHEKDFLYQHIKNQRRYDPTPYPSPRSGGKSTSRPSAKSTKSTREKHLEIFRKSKNEQGEK